jgi:3-hydroxybutyryl-CoA dehydrogenase
VSGPAASVDSAVPIGSEVLIRRIAIIGAGRFGRRLAELCSQAGCSIVLEDVLPSRLRGAARRFAETSPSSKVEFAATVEEAVRDADLVIDCVPDELESKLEIFSLIDRMAPPRTIIATPTRALSIADLASCTYRPERCLALQLPRGFLEDDTSSTPCIVEIVQTDRTDPAVLAAVVSFWRSIDFESTVALDSPATDSQPYGTTSHSGT